MPFFEDVDNSTIIERHIRRLTGLEREQALRLQRVYIRARNSLKQRLAFTPRDTFTEAQMKVALAELEQVLSNLSKITRTEILLGAQMSTDQAQEDLVKEVNRFQRDFQGIRQPIPLDIVLEALEPKNFLVNRYISSVESYNTSMRAKMQRILGESLLEKLSLNKVVSRMENAMAVEEWRLLRIVRTELHHIYNVSKMKAMGTIKEKELPGLKKALIHPMDLRTGDDSKSLAVENPVVDVDKPFSYKWKEETRTFMAPPDRPNDRAILVPFLKEWDT